jgi:hypothetical protein
VMMGGWVGYRRIGEGRKSRVRGMEGTRMDIGQVEK